MQQRFTRALSAALLLIASSAAAEKWVVTSRLKLTDMPEHVGGLSAIEVMPDGRTALVLSDRGRLFEGQITRTPDGALAGFAVINTHRLRHNAEHNHPDSEGLAVDLHGGDIAVSAEDPTRVLTYRLGERDPVSYHPDIPTTRSLSTNRGLEAVARAQDGSLYTFFEAKDPDAGDFPLYRLHDGVWEIVLRLPAQGSFMIVGADFGPDGRLYVLERAFSGLGFRNRIKRLDLSDPAAPAEVLYRSALGEFDNLEGLAVSETLSGTLRITAVSDNNFVHFLRSELVEFAPKE